MSEFGKKCSLNRGIVRLDLNFAKMIFIIRTIFGQIFMKIGKWKMELSLFSFIFT
jgi:hypothetical protein